MARTASSFARPKPRYKPQPRLLVLCEDSKSSRNYLAGAAHHFKSYAQVEIAHCGNTDPMGIVAEAGRRRKSFDTVYCVFDRDAHTHFDAALIAACRAGVEVVPSYPCYEYWLLLHFVFTRAPQTAVGGLSAADRVVRELRGQPGMANYDKGTGQSLFQTLLDRLPAARVRSVRALAEALDAGGMNPSTELHNLIDVLERLGTLETVA